MLSPHLSIPLNGFVRGVVEEWLKPKKPLSIPLNGFRFIE